jgi:hypothetical protein
MRQHYAQRPARSFRLKWLLLLLVTFAAYPAMATHFRYGNMTWKRDLAYTGPGYKIDFTVTESWRRGFAWTGYGTQQFNITGSPTLPDPGEKIRFYNNFPLIFGDGTPNAQIVLDVTSIVPTDANPNNDIVNGVFLVSHIYQSTATTPVPANYLVYFEGAARLNAGTGPALMLNNGGGSFRVESRVTVGNGNDAPVSTLPPVVNMITGLNPATYQIPATDPNGDVITYSLAPSASFTQTSMTANTQPFPVPGNPSASTRLNVSPTGLLSFNTTGLATTGQYNAVVRLTDSRGAYNHLDIIIRIVPTSNAPIFDYTAGQTPANNTTYTVPYGTNVAFNVRATDPDAADAVTLFGTGLPVGATLTPTLPLTGPVNGAAATAFSWTPAASQIGNNVLTFVAQDPQGVQRTTSVNINVTCAVGVSGTATGATCNGANGSIAINTSGGTAPFTYSVDGGTTFGSSNAFNGLAAGNYAIQVRESNGCVVERNVRVDAVPDTIAPVITTNGNKNISADPGICGANVSVTATASDNCGAHAAPSGTRSDALPLNAAYPVGTTTITWTASDNSSNAAIPAVQTVTVTDNELPVITAPANVSVSTDAGLCSASGVALGTPAVSDNCSVASFSNDAPATFPTGSTTVTWTVNDVNGNSSTALQTVTVTDNQNPTITAPANFTVGTDPGQCSASGVTLGAATTADNCGVATVTNNAPAVFPKGMTMVIWTVTDIHGNTATANQAVTVIDNENPIIAAPSAVSANADPGQCYATITDLGFPTFQDNCPGSSYTSTANANSRYNVGVTVVGYTVTDAAGHQATAFQAVVVTDNQNPTITAPAAVTVATNPGQCQAAGVALGTPATADNCGVGQVTNDAPATFPKGSTIVTWTVRDVNGNTATATQTVTVEDLQNPTIIAPAAVTVGTSADGTGNCTTRAALGTAMAVDNCGAATITAKVDGTVINPATYDFPIGVTTVTWTATDGSGNTAIATQTVTVTDDETPAISCPANVIQCYNAGGNNVSVSVNASDNCSSTLSTTYAITGATTATGTGGSVNRSFNLGTSTVTWTVRDAANNVSTCSITVTVRPLPTAGITVSGADEFCNATTLTAGIAPAGAATYAWTYNNAPFATTQSIKLKVSNNDGTYRVVVTDAFGCSSAPASYNFQKQTLVNMYVLLGMKDVDLAQNNNVINGSVGVTSSSGEADFDRYCSVASTGAFVKAADINVRNPVTIPTKIYSQAIVTLPAMYLNSSNPGSLSNYVMTTSGTVSGNKKDLTINSNKTVTVTGNVFRKIRICHDADVTFTAADISMESLDIDNGATVRFTGNTKLRVSDEVTVDKECSINPAARIVTFYIKDPSSNNNNCFGNWNLWHSWLSGSSEKFVVDGRGTNIIANVYVPNGKIRVHGNGWLCNWYQTESCNMMGLFIAEEIQGDGKNINWYSYDCAMPASFRQAAPVAQLEEAADYKVKMYPNPTTGQFTLQFGNTAEAADVRITDIQGRLISMRKVGVNEMPSATFNLNNQVPGVYMVEIRQGANTVRDRIVLQ